MAGRRNNKKRRNDTTCSLRECSQRESNPQLALRRRLLYPFNYENECRFVRPFGLFGTGNHFIQNPLNYTDKRTHCQSLCLSGNNPNHQVHFLRFPCGHEKKNQNSTVPCIQILPLNLRPTAGSPRRSLVLIHTSNSISLLCTWRIYISSIVM